MEQINKLLDLINESKISIIGYDYRHEDIKDVILSKLNCNYIHKIDTKFSLKQFLRDVKIGFILEGDKYSNIIVIDINDIIIVDKEESLNKSSIIGKFLRRIKEELYNTNYKLIVTSPIYRTPDTVDGFRNGNTSLYISDTAFILNNKDSIRIIKNRFSGGNNDISIKELNNYEYSNK